MSCFFVFAGRVGDEEGWFPCNHTEAKKNKPMTRPRSTYSLGRLRVDTDTTCILCFSLNVDPHALCSHHFLAPQADGKQYSANPLKFVAQYEYAPNYEDELKLKPGVVVSVLQQPEGGWWLGKVNGR